MKKRVGILISGRGSNMMALVEAARAADYPAEIAVVISNRPEAPGITWARENGLRTAGVDHKAYATRAAFEAALQDILLAHPCDLVACCGFMRVMTAEFVTLWRDRMLNIHPSLLPSYKGLHTHERALADGVKIAGCTVHFVAPDLDSGPIVAQAAVPVLSGDTVDALSSRVLAAEHQIYPRALALVASGQASVVDGRVVLATPEAEHVLGQVALISPPLASPKTAGAIRAS